MPIINKVFSASVSHSRYEDVLLKFKVDSTLKPDNKFSNKFLLKLKRKSRTPNISSALIVVKSVGNEIEIIAYADVTQSILFSGLTAISTSAMAYWIHDDYWRELVLYFFSISAVIFLFHRNSIKKSGPKEY